MIKSRTSSTSLIPNPPLLTSVALRASEPLRLGVKSPRPAQRPNSSLRKIAFLGPEFAQLDDTPMPLALRHAPVFWRGEGAAMRPTRTKRNSNRPRRLPPQPAYDSMGWGSLCVAREAPKAPRLRHCNRPTWVDLPLAVRSRTTAILRIAVAPSLPSNYRNPRQAA